MGFRRSLDTLIAGLDPEKHRVEIKTLKRCRTLEQLDALGNQWLTPGSRDPRLKLIKHHTGTFLVLEFVDGWGTTMSQADFWRR
ncbi:MAG: hypothetical protein KC912_18735 [Proteobacteria bacterium]|nr:hypothetical protein [Pseudomonadota bacterium]